MTLYSTYLFWLAEMSLSLFIRSIIIVNVSSTVYQIQVSESHFVPSWDIQLKHSQKYTKSVFLNIFPVSGWVNTETI